MRSPFEVKSLVEWLRKKPADATFCYLDTHGCLLYQYFTEKGFSVRSVGGDHWTDTEGNKYRLSKEFRVIASAQENPDTGIAGLVSPRRFGYALKIAEDILAGTHQFSHFDDREITPPGECVND